MRGMIVRENPVSVRREMGPKVRKRMESATKRFIDWDRVLCWCHTWDCNN
jgi:hypothetical protein